MFLIFRCTEDKTVKFHQSPGTTARFSFRTFRFRGIRPYSTSIHCQVMLCDKANQSCNQPGCTSPSNKKRMLPGQDDEQVNYHVTNSISSLLYEFVRFQFYFFHKKKYCNDSWSACCLVYILKTPIVLIESLRLSKINIKSIKRTSLKLPLKKSSYWPFS